MDRIELEDTPKSEPNFLPDTIVQYETQKGALQYVHNEVGYGDGYVKVVKVRQPVS